MSAKELKFENGTIDWQTDNDHNTINIEIRSKDDEIWDKLPIFSSFEKANEFLEKTIPNQLKKGETKKYSQSVIYSDKDDTKDSYTTATITFKYYKAGTLVIDVSKFKTEWDRGLKKNSNRTQKSIKLGKLLTEEQK